MDTARWHHYVPQWLQRRFLAGEPRMYYLDLAPERIARADGSYYTRREILRRGPEQCFGGNDLYATRFPGKPRDLVERQFFGVIDDRASKAFQYIVEDKMAPRNEYYTYFLQYMSVQKIRTPKGLDWLRPFAEYAFKIPMDTPEMLFSTLADIGEMHVTTWSECLWEVVDAVNSGVGFLLSDHPVTAYNAAAFPGSRYCRYPLDPVIELIGTRTIFPLDARHCLFLSNKEYVQSPLTRLAFRVRTNPRAFGFSTFSPLYINRGRSLSTEEVLHVNYIIKARAKRYIAAQVQEWLYPERALRSMHWPRLDRTLQPVNYTLQNEIWMEYADGSEVAIDAYGRPITDPERWAEMKKFKEQIALARKN